MRNIINIQGHNQDFKYMVEYVNTETEYDVEDTTNINYFVRGNNIYLHHTDDVYFHNGNEWYKGHDEECVTIADSQHDKMLLRLYFPCHSLDNYKNGVNYMLTAETYIGGYRIELGSFLIQRMNCQAIESGVIEFGSEKYYDCMEIDIINPYYIMYSNKWADFRMNECGINQNTNNTGSIITVSLSIVTENENGSYMVDKEYICGYTSFNISKDSNGYLKLNLEPDLDNLGWKLTTIIPKSFCEYTDEQGNYLGGNSRLNRYIYDTYGGMDIASIDDVKYELVAKNNNTIIRGPSVSFTPDTLVNPLDDLTQTISWETVLNEDDYIENDTLECEPNSRCGLKHFFEMWSGDDTWPHFEEGWVMQASMMVTATITIKEKDKNGNEITYVHPNNETYILSNEVPITQEIFKYFVGWDLDSLKNRQKIDDMKITNYTLVNKIVNEIVQLERPDKSKSNIIQPVFFRSVDSEFITIHPSVTENICINLDNYKSKVKSFILQIENCTFTPIGVNQYGIIFKVTGNILPQEITEGTYYILDENSELVTKGKYKYSS